MADNERLLELLAEKKRAREELELEIAQLTAKLGSDQLSETSPANSAPLGTLSLPPPPPEQQLAVPPKEEDRGGGGGGGGGDNESDLPRTGRIERLSSFGRLSMSSLPERCHLNKEDIQLLGQVGKGSFGVVWKAKYRERSEVAVKLFLYEDVESEIVMLASIAPHPHVLNFLGVIFQVDDPYKEPQVALVTKFMGGGSLYERLVDRKSPLFDAEGTLRHSFKRTVHLAAQTASGVAHLHHQGIIHRDLACRNILLDEDGSSVAVADFGFARLRAKTELGGFSASKTGPVRWEAPESLRLKQYSEATDAFMFGVTLWEMCSGAVPWKALPTAAAAHAVLCGERLVVPLNCDPVMRLVILQCWQVGVVAVGGGGGGGVIAV